MLAAPEVRLKNTKKGVIGLLCTFALLAPACGGGGGGGGNIPAVSGTRESGQSSLMDQTVAGRGKCDPNNHERPFIIEWDATDMSSFEAYAANDVVVVQYEGCNLKVLDRCRDDSVRGSLGAYRPVDWTSGSLETIDISNEGDLYAKLPLGVVSLGGRVSAGEKFHMEYYVAGTRGATRATIYNEDLSRYSGCKGATHFVYAYNLGAFALGSRSEIRSEVGGSVYGFGAGGSNKKTNKAAKKGGELAACKSESAQEIDGCKAPIRLTLRPIEQSENPDKAAQRAPDTDASLNAAGKVNQRIEMSEEARAHYDSALVKMNAKDGKGCLAELAEHDKRDPKHMSTDPKSPFGSMRGQCLMLAGQCDAGRTHLRKSMEMTQGASSSPEQIDRIVEALAGRHCQGGNMNPRDQFIKAMMELQQGTSQTKSAATCSSAYNTVRRLTPQVKPKNEDDNRFIIDAPKVLYHMASNCLARAGDCAAARRVFNESYPAESLANVKDPKLKETIMKSTFDLLVTKCATPK